MAKIVLIVEDNAPNMKLFDGVIRSLGQRTIRAVEALKPIPVLAVTAFINTVNGFLA